MVRALFLAAASAKDWRGAQHSGDGRVRLAGAGFLHPEQQADDPCCLDPSPPQSEVTDPAGR